LKADRLYFQAFVARYGRLIYPAGRYQNLWEEIVLSWFARKKKGDERSQSVFLGETSIPGDIVVYAIGDIHGRADLLENCLVAIQRDPVDSGIAKRIVYLGDYIDRGPESRKVIDMIREMDNAGVRQTKIIGNHEEFLLRFLNNPEEGTSWLSYGGAETLLSYGVGMPAGVLSAGKLAKVAEDLRSRMEGSGHLVFLQQLEEAVTIGDYCFVHAGINPDRSLEKQIPEDLRWIREPFLTHTGGFEKVIVHGHTITDEPEFRPNRIGIDTGAY
tara:strand:- start:46 stop:861 length:816 start_codon:yes stop_codon:yes gene_type:complete